MRGGDAPFDITFTSEGVPSLDELRRFRDSGADRLIIIGRALSAGGKTVEAMLDGLARFAEEGLHRL